MKLGGKKIRPLHALIGSILLIPIWQGLVLGASHYQWPELHDGLVLWGTLILFLVGLSWVVWGVEKFSQRAERRAEETPLRIRRIWNPLNPNAWYYGRQSQRYKQSLTVLSFYSVGFLAVMMLLSLIEGCATDEYDLPAGGGEDVIQQKVKIQKVVRKKFVINPFSSILFNPPPIEQIDPQILETTQHRYAVGQGSGEGSGFSSGTSKGMVRFIRLEYSGGDWDQDYGVGRDLNLLQQYGLRTRQKVAKKTEHVTVAKLGSFPPLKSPPLIYLTGQKSIHLTSKEKKILRTYLLERHGMIFGDNGGSRNFHNQFVALMRELTGAREVAVPLDDVIHRRPYTVPFLPYVAPHGGKVALGWKKNGRWVAYYHPGDIGDAWADDHAGVKPRVYEACYQLGVNVIFYAHAEHNKWRESQKKP